MATSAELFKNGIVRIESGGRTGTGFVVSADGLILTCAHVVGEPRPDTVQVIFQATDEERKANVLADGWRTKKDGDIAVLHVEGGLPATVAPLPLGSAQGTETHGMVTFGYPNLGDIKGAWGRGTIVGDGSQILTNQTLLQLDCNTITKGFSGAPVWDEARKRVIGMVVTVTSVDRLGKQSEMAHAIPTETLRKVVPSLVISEISPYRNLAAFTEDDAPFFFGRKIVIDDLVRQLQNNRRFLAVLGPSGSGKSSVVQAGLIPQIHNGAVPGSKQWRIILTRPTNFSFQQQLIDLETILYPVALVIDQFEELFVSYENDVSTEIIARLTKFLNDSPHVTLIIVIRNEFYNRLISYDHIKPWVNGAIVRIPLDIQPEDMEAIVREPARVVGWQFDEGLVNFIIRDILTMPTKGFQKVGSSTLLPLLEFALTQLWEACRQEGLLTREAYQGIGGVTGSLTRWAEETYTAFDERLRPLVQHIFKALIYLGDPEQGVRDSRRRRPVSSLARISDESADIDHVIRHLANKHLLVTSQIDQSQPATVELIHDALLWEWSRLQQWVTEDRPFLLWHQALERHVEAWTKTNPDDVAKRDSSRLLTGANLKEAQEKAKKRVNDLTTDEHIFIRVSKGRQRQYGRRTVLMAIAGFIIVIPTVATIVNWLEPKQLPLIPSPDLPLPYIYHGHKDTVTSVAWSPDGLRIASGNEVDTLGDEVTVQVWSTHTGRQLITYRGHKYGIRSIAWAPDGNRIASAGAGGIVEVSDNLSHIVHSENNDSTLQVWNANNGNSIHIYKGSSYNGEVFTVDCVTWSPNGMYIASGGADKTVRVWNTQTGTLLCTYRGHTDWVNSAAWSPDNKRIVSGGGDGTVQMWEASTGNLLFTYLGHIDLITDVAWSPDGSRIASASQDKTVQLWDAHVSSTILSYHEHEDNIVALTWSPDSTRIASASRDNTVRIWDINTNKNSLIYRKHKNWVFSVAWSPDGKRIVSAGADHTVQIWDPYSGELLRNYRGHTVWVNSVAWSPDGAYIASVSKTVQVWSASTGRTIFTYKGNSYDLSRVAWSPDGTRLASTSADKTVLEWRII